MPIYEYFCPKCGHEMENLQNVNEPPLTHCPKCGEDTLKKKMSAAGFQLKGSGWYATDFKDKKPNPTDTKDTADKDSTTAATEKPVEAPTKTEEKKEKQQDASEH